MNIIGIDPGKTGGIAVLDSDGRPLDYLITPLCTPQGTPMTVTAAQREDRNLPKSKRGIAKSLIVNNIAVGLYLAKFAPCRVFIETQSVTIFAKGKRRGGANSSPAGALAIGKNYGLLIAECRRYEYYEITPQRWYKALGITAQNGKPSIGMCLAFEYPLPMKRNGEPNKSKAEGVADAWMIARYGWLLGEPKNGL